MKKLLIVAIAILFVAGFSATAKAFSLVPGGLISPFSSGSFTLPSGATLLAFINQVPVSGQDAYNNVVFSGTLSEKVYSVPNVGMLFEYTFSNTGPGKPGDTIGHLSVGGYTGFTTDVDANGLGVSPFGPGLTPSSIDRSGSGDVLDFNFLAGVPVGFSSDTLWIQTNAPSYTFNSTQLQDGGNSQTPTYGPATPEPATMLMFGMGALGLVGLRKRKVA